jgi:amino acid transporter
MNGLHPEDSAMGDRQQPWMSNEVIRFSLAVAITAVLSFISYRGLDVVGSLSSVVCVISMSPFVLLCIFGLPHIQPSRWMVLPIANDAAVLIDDDALTGDTFFPEITFLGILWRPFVNNLFWNLNSFDVGASFAGEVHNPGVVFPRAMMLSLALVWLSYVLPLLVALGASDTPQQDWKAGHLTVVAQEVVGSWLAAWTVLAAAVSNIALFLAEMSGDAYQLMGMADRGLIPKVFCKRSRFETPTNGILLGTMVIFCLSVAKFDALVEMLNFAYSFALLMEFAAFIKLRMTEDEDVVERPFRLPFGVVGCILFVLPSCLICILIMVTASKMTYLYIFFLVIFGACFHLVQKAAHHYKWWEYVQAAQKKGKKVAAAAEMVVHA